MGKAPLYYVMEGKSLLPCYRLLKAVVNFVLVDSTYWGCGV